MDAHKVGESTRARRNASQDYSADTSDELAGIIDKLGG
jgi:hypothetical protein